jgi:ABC-2 type transport system ATP-binding protein
MNALVRTEHLARRFHAVEAVRDLSLEVPRGEVVALLGPNGAGKTTALRTIANVLEPTAGHAFVFGVDSRRLGPRELQRLGYVSENQELPEALSGAELFAFLRPLYPTWDDSFARELSTQFRLPLTRPLHQVSRGVRMKTALVSSLAYRPELLLLDEPFAGLDPLVREEVIDGVLAIGEREGWTVLLCSHDVDEVERLADRVAILNHGRLALVEETEALLARHRAMEVVVETARAWRLDTFVRWADGRQEAARIVLPAVALDSPQPAAGERLSVDGLGAVARLSLPPSAWVAAVSPAVWQEEHASAGVGSAVAHARLQLVRQRLVMRLPLRARESWRSGSERILLLRVTMDDALRVLVHETGPLGRTPTREEGRPWNDDGACLRFYAIHNPVSHELIGVRWLGGWAPRNVPPVAGGLQIEDFDLELVWPKNERWRERSARHAWLQGAELVKIEETIVAEGERTVELPELRLPAPPPSLLQ